MGSKSFSMYVGNVKRNKDIDVGLLFFQWCKKRMLCLSPFHVLAVQGSELDCYFMARRWARCFTGLTGIVSFSM